MLSVSTQLLGASGCYPTLEGTSENVVQKDLIPGCKQASAEPKSVSQSFVDEGSWEHLILCLAQLTCLKCFGCLTCSTQQVLKALLRAAIRFWEFAAPSSDHSASKDRIQNSFLVPGRRSEKQND